MLTDEQRKLLEDKVYLWTQNATKGNMDLRDYNRRCAEALTAALSLPRPASDKGEEEPVAWLKEWSVDGESRRRVDRQLDHEPWLDAANPTVTPLYARPSPGVSREEVIEAIKYHTRITVGDYGLTAELEDVEDAADAILALISRGEA